LDTAKRGIGQTEAVQLFAVRCSLFAVR